MKWFGVTGSNVRDWADHAKPFLERVLENGDGDYSAEDILEMCEKGQMQLWMVYDEKNNNRVMAVVITSLPTTKLQRRCHINYLAGDNMKDWLEFYPQLEAWARSHDCRSITLYGRPGWERVLSGFNPAGVVLRKEL